MSKKWLGRSVIPAKSNKYFISTQYGGYNKCILGNALYRPYKGSVLSNCVGYAYGRFMEIGGTISGVTACNLPTANAEDWYSLTTAYNKSQIPSLGAVIVWSKGKTGNSTDGCGHVAIVERINKDAKGNIISLWCSESDWSSPVFKMRTVNYIGGKPYLASGYDFLGFIENPWAKSNYEWQTGEYKVTENLNLRKGKGTDTKSLAIIPKGTKITITATKNNWGKTKYAGKTGYVCLEYTEDLI